MRPGPHPSPLRLKMPGLDGTISMANGRLAFPSTETMRADAPSGAESGIRASTRVLVTLRIRTGVVRCRF
jgi:hypothetical protein